MPTCAPFYRKPKIARVCPRFKSLYNRLRLWYNEMGDKELWGSPLRRRQEEEEAMKLREHQNYIKEDRKNDDGTVSVDRTYFIDSRLARREELGNKLFRYIYPKIAKGLRSDKEPYALRITGTIPAEEAELWEQTFHKEMEECYFPLIEGEEDWLLYRESYRMRNDPNLIGEYTKRPPGLLKPTDYPIRLVKGENYIEDDRAVPYAQNRIWVNRVYLVLLRQAADYEKLQEIYAALQGKHAFGWFGKPAEDDYGLQSIQMPFGLKICGEITKKQLSKWEPVFHKLLSESNVAYFTDLKSWKRYLAQAGFDSDGEML